MKDFMTSFKNLLDSKFKVWLIELIFYLMKVFIKVFKYLRNEFRVNEIDLVQPNLVPSFALFYFCVQFATVNKLLISRIVVSYFQLNCIFSKSNYIYVVKLFSVHQFQGKVEFDWHFLC